MSIGLLDQITTLGGSSLEPDVPFGFDNGRFGKGWPGYGRWWDAVLGIPRDSCLFVTAPDIVGDAEGTLLDSAPWLPLIRSLGLPAALVGQDGLEKLDIPWDTFDVFFIGGSTEWKDGPEAAAITAEAKARGKKVHMGRVNTKTRILYAHSIGCDTVDGTFLRFGPNVNLPKLLRWMLAVQD